MPELSEHMRRNFFWVGLWTVAIVVSCICYYDLQNGLGVLVGIFVLATLLLPAIILVVCFLVALFKETPKLPSVFGMVWVITLSALFVSGVGIQWGSIVRFYLEKWNYESTVAKILSARTAEERKNICAGKCKVAVGENSKPEKIIFPWTRVDVLVGWYGIVYDPTGKIIEEYRADQERKNDANLNTPVKRTFFESPLLYANHLTGNWYLCHFWHD